MNCPLCGGSNECGIKAFEENQEVCWCFHEKFPEELLQKIPEQQRGKACVCKSCAAAFRNDTMT
ncbi:cysteine-rich CWC family protein [Paenibacillus sp. LHD-38]|uniref:cysteine-rich CWC family protein n=1 Tax=Paenibacillus sp. LHD-38 TaxID=3072143 RepID=UPI00280CE2FA|nr:cysteine-rich CWC family protein [Paenibacillus sp. LHD-38]MDQ8736052.1 cysteine-rich CWC family protein [Paenibacillus sp. LHD-38]